LFRVRRIFDDLLPVDRESLLQVQEIMAEQFPEIRSSEISGLSAKLRTPLVKGFQYILLVAEGAGRKVKSFALLLHDPFLRYCYLDYIAATGQETGRGLGSILYERVRQEAMFRSSLGIFFECLPDDPCLCRNPDVLAQNASRLKFYERYGARPIVNTLYETPLEPGGDNPPYLVFDDLGKGTPISRKKARSIVRHLLEKKYADICSPEYIEKVVTSFKDDPVRVRPFRYINPGEVQKADTIDLPEDQKIFLVMNKNHQIHHVREKGYVESPVRIKIILREILKTGLFKIGEAKHFGRKHLLKIHDRKFIDYMERLCMNLKGDTSVYPYVFPVRNKTRPPHELSVRAGYYCIDTFTPLNRNAFLAATDAVNCSLTAADQLMKGRKIAYALVRPPGHHAERASFGGFCYMNSLAAAAEMLSSKGKVAILDIDYHHGNGQQDIFYRRNDVLTLSIHGHPNIAYPYFSGFEDEKGEGQGKGFNINYPLKENLEGEEYRLTLKEATARIRAFRPSFLVIALGLDTSRKDPTGSWNLTAKDFLLNGELLGILRKPTLIIQEGGYNTRFIGTNAKNFFLGFWRSFYEWKGRVPSDKFR